jgi:hypothetical protein
MAAEDERLAVTIKTTLAGSLLAAVFAIIAVQTALVVFVMDKRDHLGTFAAVEITAAVLVIGSAILSAKGIAKVYKAGHSGAWNIDAGKPFFSAQAITGGLGLLLIVISAFCGNPKPDPPKEPAGYQHLKNNVEQLQKDVSALQAAPKPQPSPPPRNKKKQAKK